MSVIQKAYNDVQKFNAIADNFSNVDKESIKRQISFITEELKETQKAFDEGDSKELLDGLCDVFVTWAGLAQKMSVAGYDVPSALKRVNENNLSKFPKRATDEDLENPDRFLTKNFTCDCVVLKNAAGKIMKPSDFKPVDLSDLVPPNFFKGE